jgi:hypothetical protein
MPRACGASSIPETAVLEPIGRGVLDHQLSRMMTSFGAVAHGIISHLRRRPLIDIPTTSMG